MPESPQSPFRLTRTRIVILLLVGLALASIIGAVTGGLTGYRDLREAASSPRAEPAVTPP